MKTSIVTVKRGSIKRKSNIISKIQNGVKSTSCSKTSSHADKRQKLQRSGSKTKVEANNRVRVNLKPKDHKGKSVQKITSPISNLNAATKDESAAELLPIVKSITESKTNTRKRTLRNTVTKTGSEGIEESCIHKVETCKRLKGSVVEKDVKNDTEIQAISKVKVRAEKRVRRSIKGRDHSNTQNSQRNETSMGDIENDIEEKHDLKPKNLKKVQIRKGIAALFSLINQQSKNKNPLFQEEHEPIFLQVTCIKVPKVSTRQLRILLPHTLITDTDDAVLFVKDLKKGRRKDYEPTVNHFKELLEAHGCANQIKEVIPMNQVKTEYGQYELKRRLVSTYDYFLIDGRISGHMSHLLGKIFIDKRKLPTSIKMDNKDLKKEINLALRKTCMQLHSHGNTNVVQVGHTSMEEEKIFENILAVGKYLAKNYPGNWSNIRSLYLKTATSLAIPIYVTLKSNGTVKIPVIPPKRPKAYQSVHGELSTIPGNVSVSVTPDGSITLYKNRTVKDKNKIKDNI